MEGTVLRPQDAVTTAGSSGAGRASSLLRTTGGHDPPEAALPEMLPFLQVESSPPHPARAGAQVRMVVSPLLEDLWAQSWGPKHREKQQECERKTQRRGPGQRLVPVTPETSSHAPGASFRDMYKFLNHLFSSWSSRVLMGIAHIQRHAHTPRRMILWRVPGSGARQAGGALCSESTLGRLSLIHI